VSEERTNDLVELDFPPRHRAHVAAGVAVVGAVVLTAVFGISALWSRVDDDTARRGAVERTSLLDTIDPAFVDAMAELLRGTATLGIERSGKATVLSVPTCFGPVSRIALASEDLTTTLWEVEATGDALPVDVVAVGEVPLGFVEVVEYVGPDKPVGWFVANGPTGAATTGVAPPGNVLPSVAASCH
jgi:hypothetical protein